MPCQDYDAPHILLSEANAKCDKLTRMLCSVLSLNGALVIDDETDVWWREHKAADERRMAKEKHDAEIRALAIEADERALLAKLKQKYGE